MQISRVDPRADDVGGDGLTDMQRRMLASIADDGDRHADVTARFIALNKPHPFLQQAALTLDERMAGMPDLAVERARHAVAAGKPDRYSGIVASSVLRTHHNFSSGGYFYTAYAEQFGDQKAQLGNILNEHGSIDSPTVYVNRGRWFRVQPLSVDSALDWAFVWIDATVTRLHW
jgi:hypothetical protein